MTARSWTFRGLRAALAAGSRRPSELAESALANSNGNAGRNTYIWQDADWTRAEAARAETMQPSSGGPFGDGRSALWGLPISVKDCFDLAGSPTSCGVHFYRDRDGKATRDSWLVERLACFRSRDRRQNSSSRAGLRDYRRESRIWRLCAASRFRRAHRGLVKRRCGQRAGGLGGSCHRHGHRRIGARAGRALRSGRLSRHARSRRLARRCSSGGIL